MKTDDVGKWWTCAMTLALDMLPLRGDTKPVPLYLSKALGLKRGTTFGQAHKWANAQVQRHVRAGTLPELVRPAMRLWAGPKATK